jgi:hypothetical protein
MALVEGKCWSGPRGEFFCSIDSPSIQIDDVSLVRLLFLSIFVFAESLLRSLLVFISGSLCALRVARLRAPE